MVWPTGNIDITKFDADSDSISASRPELYKIAIAVNDMANTGGLAGNAASYVVSAETATGGANLRLTSSGGITDDVKFASGTAITVARTDANTVTINNSGVTSIVAGTGISVSGANGAVTITNTSSGGGGIERVAGSFATGTTASTTTEIVSLSVLIPANTFSTGDVVEIYHQYNTTGGGNQNELQSNVYVNTSNAIGGSNIDSDLIGDTASKHLRLRTSVDVIASNGNTRGFVGGGSASATNLVYEGTGFGQDGFSPSPSTYSINWTVNQYIIFGVKRTSAGATDTGACVGYQIYRR
jgi:hypothetical protein